MEKADYIVGQNWMDFDDRAIKKVYPWYNPKGQIIDTLIWSRLLYPEIQRDGPNKHKLPGNLKRSHSLKAWGLRLGIHKGDYAGGWKQWSPEMHEYMDQDVEVLIAQFKWLRAAKPVSWGVQYGWDRKKDKPIFRNFDFDKLSPPPVASQIEHEFAAIIRRMESRGFTFDHGQALKLQAELQKKEAALETALIGSFGEWWQPTLSATAQKKDAEKYHFEDEEEEELDEDEIEQRQRFAEEADKPQIVVIKKTRQVKMIGQPNVTIPRVSKTGKVLKPYIGPPKITYSKGAIYMPIERVQFNPASRAHVRKMLKERYGWKPTKFTPTKQPIVDDDVLKGLPYPEAKLLAEYYMLLKRLGQLATGEKAWLLVAKQDGPEWRIHCRINTCGTPQGRCTHADPNVSQTPKANERTPYGKEMRSLWIPRKGYRLVGFDGAGMQLRMLGHYLHRYDGGAYSKIVSEEDPHAWLRDTIGTDIMREGDLGRDYSKTTMYAYIFGARDPKLGSIILETGTLPEKRELGAMIRSRINTRFEAVAKLSNDLDDLIDSRGYILGLDKRMIRVRKKNATLNALLMCGEAVVMKKALSILDRALQYEEHMSPGLDYEFVANIHDEDQAEVLPAAVPGYVRQAEQCVRKAGEFFRLNCPLKSQAKVGDSWAACH